MYHLAIALLFHCEKHAFVFNCFPYLISQDNFSCTPNIVRISKISGRQKTLKGKIYFLEKRR